MQDVQIPRVRIESYNYYPQQVKVENVNKTDKINNNLYIIIFFLASSFETSI